MMKITRREAIRLGLVGTGTLISPFGLPDRARAAEMNACEHQSSVSGVPNTAFSPQIDRFKAPLKILQPLEPKLRKETGDGMDYYEITMQKERLGVVFDENERPLKFAEFWTYNGSIPGPLIRQQLYRDSSIRFNNLLGKDANDRNICTSIHLHGMASLPQYDGYATDLIQPDYYKDYYYPNSRASSLWYHDHAVHNTSRNVYMGLAGMYIVEYAPKDFCGGTYTLPSGEFEVPLVIQDKTFEIPDASKPDEWRLVFNDRRQQGVYADVMMVNGRAYPTHKVKRQKYYFRLLNASASRTYQLTLSRDARRLTLAGDPLIVVGSDAGLLARPEPLVAPKKSLRIGVAERYGVVIDFAQFPADVKTVYLWDMGFNGNIGGPSQAIMQFELMGDPIPTPDLPQKLGIVPLRDELVRLRTERLQQKGLPVTTSDRQFRFDRRGEWKINGKTWDINRVDAKPGLWDVEIWEITNTGGWVHPVHIHLVDFQILDRNGIKPSVYESGWKDVILVGEFETVRVIASFNPQPGKYMIHCHNIVHEDHDMMTQFEVIGGTEDPPPLDPVLTAPAQKLPAKPLGTTDPTPYKVREFSYGVLKNSCQEP